MKMTQKMFVATVQNSRLNRCEAYFDTNEGAWSWVCKMIEDKALGGITTFVIDNRDVHITEFI